MSSNLGIKCIASLLVCLIVGSPAWAVQFGAGTGSSYPTTVDSTNPRTNKSGGACSSAVTKNACAELVNDVQSAVVAIMTELGTLPKGSYADVKTRLNDTVYLSIANIFTANQTISNTAPSFTLTDTTASAKSLTIAVDANLAQLRESAGASASFITLNLATNNVAIKGTTATDLPTYGSELLTSAGWTVNAGWTESPDDTFAHTGGGGTATLTHSATIANATKYQISWTVTGRTAGSFTVSVGALASAAQTSTGSFGPTTTSTAAFTITPTTDFDGTISVTSLKQITAVSTAIASLLDSTGTTRLELRAGTATLNTFVGLSAGAYNTTGYSNSAQGVNALYSNTTGYYNSAQGVNALYSNTTGYSNSAQSVYALYSNTTGYSNSAQGVYALYSNTTGYSNSAQGAYALYSNTTGYSNSAQGVNALYSNTTGYYNSAQSVYALYSNTTGTYNSAMGYQALYSNTTGTYNSAMGYQAGRYITDGSTANQTSGTSVYLGAVTKALASGDTNEIVIGYNATGLGSNTVVLGNSSIVTTQLTGVILPRTNGASDLGNTTLGFKRLYMDYTNTATIGAVTINKASFRANIALGATSVVVTNSLVTAASKVLCVAAQNDTTGYVKASVPAAGSVTIYSPVTTADMAVDCLVINAN